MDNIPRSWTEKRLGEITTKPLLERIVRTRKPVLLSTGMSSFEEIDKIVKFLKMHRVNFTLLQSTTLYPCPPDKVGLNVILEFQKRYGCPVGLSDHSGSWLH